MQPVPGVDKHAFECSLCKQLTSGSAGPGARTVGVQTMVLISAILPSESRGLERKGKNQKRSARASCFNDFSSPDCSLCECRGWCTPFSPGESLAQSRYFIDTGWKAQFTGQTG